MELWKRNLVALWLVQFLSMAGFTSVAPFLPLLVSELGITSLAENGIWSGLLFSAVFAFTAIMSPVWGTLADRWGRKPMLIRALLGMVVCVALISGAGSVWHVLVLRSLQGILGGSIPMANALMATSAPRERMGFAMGTLQTAASSGAIVGPLIGGTLADVIGVRPVFLVNAALLVAAALVAHLFVRERFVPAQSRAGEGFFGAMRATFGLAQLRVIFFLLFLAQFSAMIIEPIVTLYISTLPGVSPATVASQAGLIFAATGLAAMAAAPLWGRLGDRTRQYKRIVTVALLGASLAYFPQGLVSSTDQLLGLRGLLGVFNAATAPAVFAIIAATVPANRQGGAFGLTFTPLMIGNVVGPIAGGLLQAAFGIRSVFLLTGSLLLMVSIASHWLVADAPRERAPAADSVS